MTHSSPGASFLASLPVYCRPTPAQAARLASKAEVLLAASSSAAELASRLTAGVQSEYDPHAALIRRLEKLAREQAGRPPGKPPWCGECDEHTRQRENAAGQPYRCPDCHPLAVGA